MIGKFDQNGFFEVDQAVLGQAPGCLSRLGTGTKVPNLRSRWHLTLKHYLLDTFFSLLSGIFLWRNATSFEALFCNATLKILFLF